MNFLKVGTLAKIASTLESKTKLGLYAKKQIETQKQEAAKIAELYPVNTVKPKPINYCHFRFELDELMLNQADTATVLKEIGIPNAELLGLSKPDENGLTYLVYKWETYYILFPLCQDFFFLTEDCEQRLKKIEPLDNIPCTAAQILALRKDYSDDVILADAFYHVKNHELIMERIACPDGPYLLSEKEDIEKVRNLIHYLRDSLGYDTAREIHHADLPHSVRLH